MITYLETQFHAKVEHSVTFYDGNRVRTDCSKYEVENAKLDRNTSLWAFTKNTWQNLMTDTEAVDENDDTSEE